MPQIARYYWGHHTDPVNLSTRPYAFWPELNTNETVYYPEDLLMTDVSAEATVTTEGMYTCHALAIGALKSSGVSAVYMLHNFADETASTIIRAQKALKFMVACEYQPVFAATLGPQDEWLDKSRFTRDDSFDGVVVPAVRDCVATYDTPLEVYQYHAGAARAGFTLIRQPDADEPFCAVVQRNENP